MKKIFVCEKHPSLAFYAGNKKHKFADGKFVTDDMYLIGKLNSMADVVCKGDYDPSEEPKPEEDNLVKLIRSIAKEEIAAALGEDNEEVEEVEEVEEDESEEDEEVDSEEDPFEE